MANRNSTTRNIPAGDISRPGVPPSSRTPPVDSPRRSALSGPADSLREISHRLEPRDFVLAHLLHQHRHLTADQIAAVLFTSPRTCRNRLNVLRKIRFVDWFRPVRPGQGRLPAHWVPGPLSARYVALYHGERPPTPKAIREAQDALVSRGHLHHTDGTNQFFVDLLAHTRQHRGTRLARWWPGRRIAAVVDHNVRPDGHGVWCENDGGGRERQTAFFLEYDTGSCVQSVLTGKLAAYRKLAAAGGPRWPVLFWMPSTAREANFHRRLNGAAHGLTVATATYTTTATAAAGNSPAGPVWKVAGNGRRRLRLCELPGRVGQAGAYHPGPPTADQDPLYLLREDSDVGVTT